MRIKQIMLIAAMVLVSVAASAQNTVENDFCIVEAPEGWIVQQTQNTEENVQSIVFW